MPKISVIIPVYNSEKYVRQCVESILNQTFSDFELICIDDKSSDNSVSILKEYACKDNRVKIICNVKNMGAGGTRNVGIKHAKGKYLMFIDADDWYEPDTFEICYNQIEKNNNDFVIFNYDRYYEDSGQFSFPTKYLSGYSDDFDNPYIKLWKLKKPFIFSAYVWTQVYNTEFIKKNNIRFDSSLRIGEDASFYFEAIIKSKTISVINKVLYHYRKYGESVLSKISPYWMGGIIARCRVYKMFLRAKHKDEYLRSFIPYYIRCCLFNYGHWKKLDKSTEKECYQLIHKIYKDLNNKYDISQYKDEINYEKFLDIAQNSWNKKHNIYFEIPDKIKLYRNKKNQVVLLIFGQYKYTQKDLDKFRKNFKKFIQNIFSVKNIKTHKVISFLGVRLKIKRQKNAKN